MMLLVAMTSAPFFERKELVAMKRSTSVLFAGLRFARLKSSLSTLEPILKEMYERFDNVFHVVILLQPNECLVSFPKHRVAKIFR